MGHVGIIAEYNPFHNGHHYQIQQAKKAFPDKEILVIMSGNYVQRGEPAILNKYIRTKMALAGGVHMVLELPSFFSTQSAEIFARGAVLSLYQTGIIDTICFGAECEQPDTLYALAKLFAAEPQDFKEKLQKQLAAGHSFPKARSIAASDYMHDSRLQIILSKPNNILAIEYLKVIIQYNLPLSYYIIQRSEDNYHDTKLPDACHQTNENKNTDLVCSATALRKEFSKSDSRISDYIPAASMKAMVQDSYNRPLSWESFYPFLQSRLFYEKNAALYQDVSKELANRISGYDILPAQASLLIAELKSKNITETRLNRCLMHILLRITKEQTNRLKDLDYAAYVRILGFQRNSVLPKLLKEHSSLPVLTKMANYKRIASGFTLNLIENQMFADDLYRQAYFNQYGQCIPSEYKHSVIISEPEQPSDL